MGKFVVKKVKSGVIFNLKAGNGEIIATSETYDTEKACLNGIESVRKNCVADIEDQSVEGFEKLKNPKYELYVDKAGKYRFRLKAKNGQIIATGEAYNAKASCKKGIESIKRNAPEASVVNAE
ncbi:MAG: YegP family protein [Clostridia bacterium]|nr:YegP family protein [Clostridia bacterium]